MKRAICIKTGYMKTGKIFCIKDKEYEFELQPYDDTEYKVNTENMTECKHYMGKDFFNNHFMYIKDHKQIQNFHLPKEDFLI